VLVGGSAANFDEIHVLDLAVVIEHEAAQRVERTLGQIVNVEPAWPRRREEIDEPYTERSAFVAVKVTPAKASATAARKALLYGPACACCDCGLIRMLKNESGKPAAVPQIAHGAWRSQLSLLSRLSNRRNRNVGVCRLVPRSAHSRALPCATSWRSSPDPGRTGRPSWRWRAVPG
jgi:hypothetical protein